MLKKASARGRFSRLSYLSNTVKETVLKMQKRSCGLGFAGMTETNAEIEVITYGAI